MTTMFLEINDDSYVLEQLTYDPETKAFTKLTERVGVGKKVTFKCSEDSERYSFHKKPSLQPATRTNEEYQPDF